MVSEAGPPSGNMDLALEVARELARSGVREICVCAGARNSPLVVLLPRMPGFRIFHFFEERSAAFFALGRIKAEGRPVAVVTTSGTAAAELLPATIEAHYTGEPLVLVTADRPRRYRGTGAPQSIEQKGLFGSYVQVEQDLEAEDRPDLASWICSGPAHLNVCFDEPLLDREVSDSELILPAEREVSRGEPEKSEVISDFLSKLSAPLVIVGGLEQEAQESVLQFLLALGAPVYLEGTSGLRERPELEGLRILSTDRIFEKLPRMKTPVDGILRIGGVPTLRFWRDLEGKRADLPVLSASSVPFTGMTRSELACGELSKLLSEVRTRNFDREIYSDLMRWDRELYSELIQLLAAEPTSEPGMIYALSRRIAEEGASRVCPRVYLGNSLPIREWDLAATREPAGWVLGANRGANGIDGQISTFFGFSREGARNWALLGDLTALYDLSAPWILNQLNELDARVVVVNNGGGKIFSRMFKDPTFQNPHRLGFEGWASMWGLSYEMWQSVPNELGDALGGAGPRVIELRPDESATARFWTAYDQLCR